MTTPPSTPRGSFADDLLRDILYAGRAFRRAPFAAATIVSTVALGLGLVAVVFTLFNVFVLRVDAVERPGELFGVERPPLPTGERVRLTRPDYDAVRRETDVFVDALAMLPDLDSRIEGRMMSGTLVSGNFFQLLGVRAALGRTLAADDDARGAGRPVMVLSHRGWTRLFQNDPAILGRALTINGAPFTIVGVMPDGFRGLTVGATDYWAPLALLGQVRPIHAGHIDAVGLDVVGRLKPGLSPRSALAGLAVWDAQRSGARASDRRGVNLVLEPRQGTIPLRGEVMLMFSPLFFAFGLILLIGCANVANLLLARAVSRQREIGIRLSLGASRRRLVRQLLTESLLLALVSAALGFVISRVVLQATVYAVTSTLSPELDELVRVSAPAADWRVALFLLAGAIVSTVSFGLVPALQATRLELVRTVRGELTRDARPGRARHALIGLQVAASALLLICAGVFLRSALASATVDPGVRTSDTVIVEIVNEPLRDAMVRAVRAEPSVATVAASWPDTLNGPRAAFAEGSGGKSAVAYKFASAELFDVLGIAIVEGRGFSAAERSAASAVAIVSESTARELWPNAGGVGQVLRLEPDAGAPRRDEPPLPVRAFTVVGIAHDVAGFRIAGYKEAGVYLPAGAEMAKTSLTVRVHGDPDLARRALLERLVTIDPNMGQVITMRTLARMETYALQFAFWLTVVLGGLALALTLSGLFGVLSYVVAQRTKEIGVRMALGATTRSVAALVLSQSIRPVGAGLVAGGSLALALAIVLTAMPAAEPIGAIVHVLDPVAYLVSLACIVAACVLAAAAPALRAARIDPMETLRQE